MPGRLGLTQLYDNIYKDNYSDTDSYGGKYRAEDSLVIHHSFSIIALHAIHAKDKNNPPYDN